MKRVAPFIYITTLIVPFLSSCAIKTRLSEKELKWMNVYKEGDTLIFKSNGGEFDTSYIVKKEVFFPQYNPIEEHGRFLPQWGVVWYRNKRLTYNPDGARLVTLEKKSPNTTLLNIDYLYSGRLFLNINSGSTEKFKKGKIYSFDTFDKRAKPEEPKLILWHEDYGIIKYITHGGVIWMRTNLPKEVADDSVLHTD